jgi:hypothetical protein
LARKGGGDDPQDKELTMAREHRRSGSEVGWRDSRLPEKGGRRPSPAERRESRKEGKVLPLRECQY